MAQTVQPLIYRTGAAAAALGVCRTTLYRMVKNGELDLVRISENTSGITAESIQRLLERGKQERDAA